MAAPSPSDYGTAAAAAYGAPLPPGWTVKATSDPEAICPVPAVHMRVRVR